MLNHEVGATIIAALDLDQPPVALAFVEQPPAGVATTRLDLPSSCAFWRSAERGMFYAPAEAHFRCAVGAMVMGFDLPEAVSSELQRLVGDMCNCGYISSDEPPRIPAVASKPKGIVYGPLDAFPLRADVVVCWLSPLQAMVWNEASGDARWTREIPAPVSGRPACAAVPAAISQNKPILSLGCIGMRTFTEVSGDRMLAIIPGPLLAEFATKLQVMRSANDTMQSYYKGRLTGIAG